MTRRLIRLTAGTLVALGVASGASAQSPFNTHSPFSVNLAPSIDNVARETQLRNAGAVAQLLAGGHDPNDVDNGRSALAIATIDDNLEIAAMLVKAGVRLNDKDEEGNAPLQHAVELNHMDIVRLLLDGGAAVDVQNRDGMTPLMLAASRGGVAIVQALLAKGANVAKTDYTGRNALDWAQDSNQTAIVQLLRRAAARR